MPELPSYHDRVNPDLLARIPVTARTVLEVGCGAGALGAAFKTINPGCRYVGLEQHVEAAAQARRRLDQVLTCDVEDPTVILPSLPPLDALIYGDVLEHLRDPWAVLACQVPLLADDGLFDRTHLRWFPAPGWSSSWPAAA